MKRKLFLLIALLVLCANMFVLSSCFFKDTEDDTNATPVETTNYEISGSLSVDVVYGAELDLSNLVIIKTTADGKVEKIPVTADMIISGGTDTIGRTPVVFMYEGYSFTKWINVKYEVIFKDGDTILKTQYVTSADEVKPPVLLSDDYTVFLGWSPSIAGVLKNNVTYTAVYERNVPELTTTLNAEYGTKLSELTLPSNAAGDWIFDLADTNTVGNLGKNKFNVSFVLKNGEKVKNDIVTINVTKRVLKLSNIVTEFTYTGQPQIPTFEFENYTVDPSNILFIQDGVSTYTNAGTYAYEFYIDDPNCEGDTYLNGTYVIKKANATVTIGDYTMSAIDSIPKIEYALTETTLTEEQIGVQIITPNVTMAGIYQIDATASNANVNLIVNRGTLTITSAHININDIGKPVIYKDGVKFDFNKTGTTGLDAIYGDDTFEDFTFEEHQHGVWRWENTGAFGDASDTAYIYKAIFTHKDTRYEPLAFEIPVTVHKKTLYFHFSNTTVDYNGKEQGIIYELYENSDPDNKGEKFEGLSVLGYERKINAGSYTVTLNLNETNYTASDSVVFKINKIDPTTDFTTVYEEIWSGSLALDKIALPDGYQWIDETIKPIVGTYEYEAKFTPVDTVNYNVIESAFTVTVKKATVVISMNEGTFDNDMVYDGDAFVIPSIAVNGTHAESSLTYAYYDKDGNLIDGAINVGTYKVIITLPETEHYNVATVETEVYITKADNTDAIAVIQNAVYGDSIDVLTLPTNANGTWTWLTDSTTVGNAGDNTFTAKYTDVSGNYLDREVTVTVKVAKKAIAIPTPENSATYVYTGSEYTLTFAESSLYTVSNNTATVVGVYTATLTLTDPDNYAWEGLATSTAGVNFRVTRADNAWITAPNADKTVWTYLDASAIFTAEAKFGTVVIEYTKDGITYSSEVPTTAGNYTARFTVAGTDDYAGVSDTVSFTINKKVVNVPEANDSIYSFVYTGSEFTLGFADSELYTVSNNKAINVNNYKALLTLTDSENYIWETGALESVTVDFAITKAQAVITDFAFVGWTYGAVANTPVANTNFGTVVFSYYQDGVKLAAKPTNAGSYTIKATVASTSNFDGAEAEIEFVIAKATASISATGTYTFTYSGNNNEIKNVTGSHNEAAVVLTLDGGEVIIVNAGTYTVKAYLAETTNYLAAELDITVVVNKANNTDTVNVNQNAVYGDSIDVLTLPTNANGTWSWLTDSTTVGNAGDNTFTAKYTDVSGNYFDREVTVTVKVAKATVNVPSVEDKEYDGMGYVPEIPTDSRYSVKENNGGTDKGRYVVILELTDSANYTWATTSESTVTIEYEIAAALNSWDEEPSITSSWVYGLTPTIIATAKYGDVKIEYAVFGTTDFTETLPKEVGSYIVRFTTRDTNYTILTRTLNFTITKKLITPPTHSMTTFVYNGEVQIPEIAKDDAIYTLTYSNIGSVNVGSYTITLSLVDNKNYAWADGSVEDIVYTYEITKANAGLNASIENWTYGESIKEPNYTADFTLEGVYFLYAGTDGNYSTTVPTNAGSYTVKAVYNGDDNIEASESAPFNFTIAKASASIGGYTDTYTTEYNGSEYVITGITDTNPETDVYFTYYKNEVEVPEIITAGTYKVVITLPESANYNEATVEVTVVVNKKANTETLPTYNMVYGDTLSMITLPASATGTWSWATPDSSVGNANAAGNTHTAIFTPNDPDNFASREVDVTVIVAKKVIPTPAVPEANKSQAYTGGELSVGITGTDLYTVSSDTATNAGTHTVTITLTDPDNYAWNDAGNTDASVTVEFSITKAENEWTAGPSLSKSSWNWGEENAVITAIPEFGTVNISYLANGTDYSATMPVSPGTHTVVISVEGNDNFTGLDATLTYTINVKYVTVPTPNKTTFVYNGSVQNPVIEENATYYTITYSNGVNVGTYTVTLELVNKEYTRWASGTEGSLDNVTYEYQIIPAQAEINGFTAPAFPYAAPTVPTVDSNFGTATFTYTDKDGNVVADISTAAPGTYYVTASIESTSNYAGITSSPVEFTITPATPEISGYGSVENSTYLNSVILDTSVPSASYNGVNVEGTFSYSAITFVESTGTEKASYVELTFVPNDTTYYKTTTIKIHMALKTVAKIGSTAYGSVENALNAAVSGNEVIVLPDATGNVIIKESVTIKAGVTLVLPYGTWDAPIRNTFKDKMPNAELGYTNDYDPKDAPVDSRIILAPGKTIENYGTIEIAGQISGGASQKYAGHTGGHHARLLLDSNAAINSYDGSEILCVGYINELSSNNGSIVTMLNGSSLYAPYVILDYVNGNYAFGYNDAIDSHAINPFNRWTMMNVSSTVRFNYGSALGVWPTLYTSSTNANNTTLAYMVGTSSRYSNAIVVLTDEKYSYMVSKYDVDTEITDLRIYGGAQTNVFKMDLTVSIPIIGNITEKIDTTNALFGISYLYNVTLAKNSELGQDHAVFDMPLKFKIMTGAMVKIEEGVTLNIKDLVVYESFEDNHYPSDPSLHYPILPAGKLIVNGTLICEKFGGKIYSEREGAMVVIKQQNYYQAFEPGTVSGLFTASKVDYFIEINIQPGESQYAILIGNSNVNAEVIGEYRYVNGEWIVPKVNLDSDGGSKESFVFANDLIYPTLPTPTKAGHVFLGWFYGDTQINSGDALVMDSEHTLVAHWRKLIFVHFDTDGGNAVDTLYVDTTLGTPTYTLTTPVKEGSEFVGWFYGDTEVKNGDTLLTTEDHTIVARWKALIPVHLNANGGSSSESAVYFDSATGTVYPTLPTPTREGYTFLGWFYGETQVNSGDALLVNGEHEVTAQWQINSYTVTIGSCSEASVSGVTSGQTFEYGATVTITITYNQSSNKKCTVKDAAGNDIAETSDTTLTFTMPASDVTITAESKASSGGSCVTPDTLITLADGTQVRVDSLTGDELLLVWNMQTGAFDFAPIMFVDSDPECEVEIIHLYFSDGTVVKVISEHGFWDYDLNKYVYLDRYADKYIGHTFAKQNGDSLEKVQLTNVVLTTETSTAWSPVTVEHLCYFVNGMLSMPGGVGGLFNIFEVDRETMTYDFEAMQNDIEKYGLYTYEELNAICPLTEDMFYAAGGAYLKISIAKGNLTEEELFAMINRYSKFV